MELTRECTSGTVRSGSGEKRARWRAELVSSGGECAAFDEFYVGLAKSYTDYLEREFALAEDDSGQANAVLRTVRAEVCGGLAGVLLFALEYRGGALFRFAVSSQVWYLPGEVMLPLRLRARNVWSYFIERRGEEVFACTFSQPPKDIFSDRERLRAASRSPERYFMLNCVKKCEIPLVKIPTKLLT